MGVDLLYMGYGVVIPVKTFVKKYLKEVNEIIQIENCTDDRETLQTVVNRKIGNFEICSLGHDAFTSRSGYLSSLEDDHEEAFQHIQESRETANLDKEVKLPITGLFCGDLMFIGTFKSLGKELGHRAQAPEVIYGFSGMLENIVCWYPILKGVDSAILAETFGQKPCMWIFAPDCICCG
jgi:hypothetical protein